MSVAADMKHNRPAEDGEPMTKVLRDGDGFDLSAMEQDKKKRRKADWPAGDDEGLYGEGS